MARRSNAIIDEMNRRNMVSQGITTVPTQSEFPQSQHAPGSGPPSTGHSEIALRKQGGAFTVSVTVNGAMTLDFMVDSGAADVSIPADVVLTLMRTGTIGRGDFLGNRTYMLADGSTAPSPTFRIRTLKVGDREVHNVVASIAPVSGSLLLGQSFLSHFASWSIDNHRGTLVLE
jgi:clan AA aspartic protease (TIGR02281 family)